MSGPWEQYAPARQDLSQVLASEAQRIGVPLDLARGVMRQESGGRVDAVSPKGARGPMQLMPATAQELGVNIDDPADNIRGGLTYLKQQLDAHGGDPRLALAAYNAGPGAVQKYGGVPPYAETQNYVDAIAGPADGPWSQYAPSAPQAAPMQPAAPVAQAPAQLPANVPQKAVRPVKVDQGLGFAAGVRTPLDNLARLALSVPAIKAADEGIANFLRVPSSTQAMANAESELARQKAQGVVPGKIGQFAGNIVGTLPTAALPGGAAAQGAVGGALLTDKRDFGGVVQDAVTGAIAGKVADKALVGLKNVTSGLLSKAPQVMKLPELEQAYKAAYKLVDQSGFRFSKTNAGQLANDITNYVKSRGGADLYPDAAKMAARLKSLANQKGGLPLTQLDDFRSQVYDVLVKPGGKEANIGGEIRSQIDKLIAKAADENAGIRTARELYTRFSKMRTVANKLDAADLQAGSAYTGKNVNNNIRQKIRPLVDPTSPQRLKNATPDEAQALRKVVMGTPAQNFVRTAGSLLDPRGVLGMGLQATGAAKTAGLSLASVPLGMGATAVGNRLSQKNVENLLRLIAAGGTKQALKKTPTVASQTAERALMAARPGVPALAVAALPRKKDRK